jgi:hypothetical protein
MSARRVPGEYPVRAHVQTIHQFQQLRSRDFEGMNVEVRVRACVSVCLCARARACEHIRYLMRCVCK